MRKKACSYPGVAAAVETRCTVSHIVRNTFWLSQPGKLMSRSSLDYCAVKSLTLLSLTKLEVDRIRR
jgi:hypothetical protein